MTFLISHFGLHKGLGDGGDGEGGAGGSLFSGFSTLFAASPALSSIAQAFGRLRDFLRSPQAAPYVLGALILTTRLVARSDRAAMEAEATAAAQEEEEAAEASTASTEEDAELEEEELAEDEE